jgi:hypothetical protein
MNQNVVIIAVVAFFVIAVITFMTLKKKEGFMETIQAPGMLSWPTYVAANDPRSDPSVNSGVVKDAINEFSLRSAPMDAANYSVDEMIDLGGCAALKALPRYSQGGFGSTSDAPVRAAFAKSSANTVAAMAATAAKFGRENVYDNAVSAEQMLPATEITAAVDPTKNFIYQRSLNTQMKRRPLGQQDLIRGDIKPVNALGRETYAASFNSGQSSQGPSGANFVSRYGNSTESLSKGYFSAYNDIEQTMARDESLMQTRAQFSRDQNMVASVDKMSQSGNFLNATEIEGILG